MAPSKDRVKPTHYPTIIFHSVRSAQCVSSLVVASVMFYFINEMVHDHYKLPWTFILLLTVSLLTITSLASTTVLHCLYGLSPVLNMALNSALTLLWLVSFGLLSWWSSGTLTHVCNVDRWNSDLGVSVCRLYKALFSFAFLGLVATLVALLLDINVQRKASSRGIFQQLQTLEKHEREEDGTPEADADSVAFRPHEEARGAGYALPAEQFVYEDTVYRGAAASRAI